MQKEIQLRTNTRVCFEMNKLKQINDKPQELLKKIYEYEKKPYGFFLLSGHNGCGKSFIAEALYYSKTPYKLPDYDSDLAIFINQSDLNEQWKHIGKESPIYFSEKFKNTKLLVLDDLGTRIPTDAFLDFLYAVVDYRWRHKEELGTIITTNKNANQFREIFGDAILDRISSGFVYRLEGKSRRAVNF